MVRKPSSPLQQVIRRLSEETEEIRDKCPPGQVMLKRLHSSGPLPINIVASSQYKELHMQKCIAKTSVGNNCVQIGSEIAIVHNFFTIGCTDYVLFERFLSKENFFDYPVESSKLNIFKVSRLSGTMQHTLVRHLVTKYFLLPWKNNYHMAVPILHCL
ncbi:hypothetical protein HOLleu_28305 [Holothuria leucospilota]|uniref:Uncharacterized protein n=1 Tax=Holothuria leucospilota TaxID=206669 RepID=A0A9Q1GY53_HOLLE|nr:hypothetical protein HOLleu_28305 [Holothuria leucospilota]